MAAPVFRAPEVGGGTEVQAPRAARRTYVPVSASAGLVGRDGDGGHQDDNETTSLDPKLKPSVLPHPLWIGHTICLKFFIKNGSKKRGPTMRSPNAFAYQCLEAGLA